MNGIIPASQGVEYEILVSDVINAAWVEWFAPLHLTHPETGGTRLHGYLTDQSALHGVLTKLRDLNLIIVSVKRLSDEPE